MKTKSRNIMLAACAALMAGALAGTADAAKGGNSGKGGEPQVSSISLNESVARTSTLLGFGSGVSYSTTVEPLKGSEYPLVYTACHSVVDGALLYGELALPDSTFVLGGGSSDWHDVRHDALCTAELRAYGGKDKGLDTIRVLASTDPFFAAG